MRLQNNYQPRLDWMEGRLVPGSLLDALNALPLSFLGDAFAGPSEAPALETQRETGGRTPPSVTGEAYGIYSALEVLGIATLNVPATPTVQLPPEGGEVYDRVLNLAVEGLLSVTVLDAYAFGEIDTAQGFALAVGLGRAADVNLLDGFLNVRVAQAVSSSFSNGTVAFSTPEYSTLVGTVGGIDIDVLPEPNTELDILGIRIILNEQIYGGDGVCTSSLTVNMIHIIGDGTILGGELIVAHAHSAANFCE